MILVVVDSEASMMTSLISRFDGLIFDDAHGDRILYINVHRVNVRVSYRVTLETVVELEKRNE